MGFKGVEPPWNNNELIKTKQLFAWSDTQQPLKERQQQRPVSTWKRLVATDNKL